MAKSKPAQEPVAPKLVEDTVDEEVIEAESVAIVPRSTAAVRTLEDVQSLMLEDAEEDLGFEKGDVAIPFFRILQSNSPQVKRQNPKYIEGAEAGMFFNSATNVLYDGMNGTFVIPVWFTRQATLWVPRKQDGTSASPTGGTGFVREVSIEEATKIVGGRQLTLPPPLNADGKRRDVTPQGYYGPNGEDNSGLELVIAAVYYLLVVPDLGDPAKFEAVAYPLMSTQMKKSRMWNALIQNARLPHPSGTGSYRAPMHGFTYKLSTIPEQNATGDWMGLRIRQGSPLIKYEGTTPVEGFRGAAQLYLAARDLKALVSTGKVKAKVEEMDTSETEIVDDGGTMAGAGVAEHEDKLPF